MQILQYFHVVLVFKIFGKLKIKKFVQQKFVPSFFSF